MFVTRLNLRMEHIHTLIQDTEKLINDKVPVAVSEVARIETALSGSIQALRDEVFKLIEGCPEQTSVEMTMLMKTQLDAFQYPIHLLSTLKTAHSTLSSEQKTNTHTIGMSRLPKLDLVKYDGDILKWSSFRDRFNASIHVKSITDVERLSYLLCAFDESARLAVEGLACSVTASQPLDIK